MKLIMLVLVAVMLVIPSLSSADEKTEAKRAAIQFVTKRLKAPLTAKFEPIKSIVAGKTKASDGKQAWDVAGYVDSENEFSAMLRQDFIVTVQRTKDGWKALDVTFLKERQ